MVRVMDPGRGPSTGDVVAGTSVALVVIPQSLAYSELAGLPPHLGLFAAGLPALLAALFVSSPYLQTGPVALTSLLTLGALEGLTEPGTSEYIALAALLALVVGVTRLLLGLLRLGAVAWLMSEPVLSGFVNGAAVLILCSQLPKVFDVVPTVDGLLPGAGWSLANAGQWHWPALLFAIGTWLLMWLGPKVHSLFPGVLIAVIAGVVVSQLIGYESGGGSVVGELPGGFIDLRFDYPWAELPSLLVAGVIIALVGFAEPASISRTFAAADRQHWDSNRELVSQGVANLAAAVSAAFPVGGSFSRSSLNRMAGATTGWSGAITGAVVLLVLPLSPLLEQLPRAVLGAVVIGAVVKLIRFKPLMAMWRQTVPQAAVATGTLIATIALSPRVDLGVLIGIGLALGVHLYLDMGISSESSVDAGILLVRPRGVVWFATVPRLDRLLRNQLADHPDVNSVIVDMRGIGRLDYSGAAALGRVVDDFREGGVDVRVTNIPPSASRTAALFFDHSIDRRDR